MMVTLDMGSGFKDTVRELGAMGKAVRKAVTAGLGEAVKLAAGKVKAEYLSGQSLKRRTGSLARSIDGWLKSETEGVVGVPSDSAVNKYKWLLGDETKTITPKKGKFLAIPIGENLTAAGVARFKSPRDVKGGFFVRTGGKLLFGYKKGKRGKFRAMFALVRSVTIKGSNALAEGVLASRDDMTKVIQSKVEGAIE